MLPPDRRDDDVALLVLRVANQPPRCRQAVSLTAVVAVSGDSKTRRPVTDIACAQDEHSAPW